MVIVGFAGHLCQLRIIVKRTAVFDVKEQICEQASYTLHHIHRAKLFTENSAMPRSGISSGIGSQLSPYGKCRHIDFGVKAVG